MADTTEKKTYLVNVESNLNKYAADAAKAADEVARLEAENTALLKSSTASTEEIEKSNSALRSAKKEYTDAKKLVDLQTQANNSNINSRKQLNAIVTLEQRRLGALANQYTINSQGVRVLSQDYINQVKRLKEAKDAIIAYDKAQSDGRSSVGLYSEAIQGALGNISMLPGSLGKAGTAAQGLSTAIKTAFATNPIGIIIIAITAAIAGLVAVFRKFQPIVEAIQRTMEGIKAVFSGVTNTIIGLVTGQKTLGESFRGLGDSIRGAYDEGVKWKQLQQDLEDLTSKNAVADAKRKTQIDELLLQARNRTLAEEQRLQLIDQALLLEEIQFTERKKIADAQVQLQEESITKGKNFTDQEKKLLHERGVEYAIEAAQRKNITDEEIKALSDSLVAQEQVNNESIALREKAQNRADAIAEKAEAKKQKLLEQAQKDKEKAEAEMVSAKAKLDKELDDYQKFLAERRALDKADVEKKKQDAIAESEFKKEQQMINAQNLLDIQILNGENESAIKRQQLEIEHQDALTAAEKTGADINLINQKYALKQIELAELENDAKLQLASQFAGNLATILGEGSAIGKAAAIAQVTIETYRGAMAAYVGMIEAIPGPIGIVAGVIAAAAAVATGIANVKKIMAVKTPGKSTGGSGGSAPTAITNSAVRGPSPQANIFQLPGLNQPQLNALPNQNPLTASDIASEISKLPAPVVTVEDINAKTAAKNKVDVRGNI